MTALQLAVCIFFGLIVYAIGFRRGLDEGVNLARRREQEREKRDIR